MLKSIFRISKMLLICNFVFSCSGDDEPGTKPYYGSVILKTQKEVDSFAALNYTAIYGNLGLRSEEIKDIEVFEKLTRINGNIWIEATDLKDINSLMNLNEFSPTSDILLISNSELEKIDGFKNLSSNIGAIFIKDNSRLEDLSGFNNINPVDGNISILNNGILENLDGISNIQETGDDAVILVWNNISLTSFCGLTKLAGTENPNFDIKENAFNPTIEEIKNGDCTM